MLVILLGFCSVFYGQEKADTIRLRADYELIQNQVQQFDSLPDYLMSKHPSLMFYGKLMDTKSTSFDDFLSAQIIGPFATMAAMQDQLYLLQLADTLYPTLMHKDLDSTYQALQKDFNLNNHYLQDSLHQIEEFIQYQEDPKSTLFHQFSEQSYTEFRQNNEFTDLEFCQFVSYYYMVNYQSTQIKIQHKIAMKEMIEAYEEYKKSQKKKKAQCTHILLNRVNSYEHT